MNLPLTHLPQKIKWLILLHSFKTNKIPGNYEIIIVMMQKVDAYYLLRYTKLCNISLKGGADIICAEDSKG